jgi:penicillin-binding protein 2
VAPTERWSEGYTANVAIGQGACEASPLQMAMVTSTIANRGISYEPRLVKRIVDQSGNDAIDNDPESPTYKKVILPPEPKVRADMHASGISDEQIELVRKGMWKVVNDPGGTGKKAQVKGIEVAGKTGTAQFWREVHGKKEKDNHTWFICFAPYEKPEFAICIMVEGGKSGGGTSAPIAQRILEEAYAVNHKGYDPGVVAMTPAPGHFRPIMEVSYKDRPTLSVGNVDDENAEDHDAPAPHEGKKERQVGDQPDIRAEPDARGKLGNRKPAQAVQQQPERKGFFQKLFGPKTEKPAAPPPRQPFFGPKR